MDGSIELRSQAPGTVQLPTDRASSLVQAFFAGKNPRTVQAYSRDLENFREFLQVEDVNACAALLFSKTQGEANHLVLLYRAAMIEQGLSPATINRRLAAIRSLVKLARTLGAVTWAIEIDGVKSKKYRDTRGPGLDGFRAVLMAAEQRNDRKGIRDVAILRLLYDLALRRGEVAGLNLEDVDLDGGRLWILGKARTEKEPLTLPQRTQDALAAWIQQRGMEPGPLFLNVDRASKGSRLTGTSIYRMVRNEYGRRVGIKVRPHGLRHAAITEVLNTGGGNYREAQRFSRHQDPRLLQYYDDNREDLGGRAAARIAAAV